MAWIRCTGNTGGSLKVRTASGAIASFETNLAEPLQSVKCEINATGGNGTPDNPIAINGYTEANMTRCGVNLFDKTDFENGYINDGNGSFIANADYKATGYIPIKGGVSYYIKTEQTGYAWGAWYDVDKNYISGITTYATGAVKTAPSNACFARLTIQSNVTGNIDTFGLNYPATDTTYHAYNGTTHVISFGQTVYGGVLDVTRGKLTVDYGIADLSDTSKFNFSYDNSSKRWQTTFSLIKVFAQRSADVLAEQWQADTTAAAGSENKFFTVGGALYFYTSDNVNKPVGNLVYPLKTPFDIDLTPEVISAIVGTNNVFADCGDIAVEYLDLL